MIKRRPIQNPHTTEHNNLSHKDSNTTVPAIKAAQIHKSSIKSTIALTVLRSAKGMSHSRMIFRWGMGCSMAMGTWGVFI
jgi:hypothetical protein